MKLLIPLALLGAALGVQACAPGSTASARTALDCPPSQGALMRTAATSDGRSCTYRTSDGAQIYLQLVSGDARATLRTLEAAVTAEAAAAKAERAAMDSSKPVETAEAAAAASDAAKVKAEAEQDIVVNTSRYGVRVTDGEGPGDNGHAKIDLPGFHVDAREGKAQVRIAGLKVDAADDGAVISFPRDVRLKGQAFSPEKRGIRATYIYANGADKAEGGYRFLGYEAAGPKVGPLAVAAMRARTRMETDDAVYEDVEKLVRKNGGV